MGAPETRRVFTLATLAFALQRGPEEERSRISPSDPQHGVVSSGLLLCNPSLGEARGVRSGPFPDLDLNTGYPCGRARAWGSRTPPARDPHPPPALVTPL